MIGELGIQEALKRAKSSWQPGAETIVEDDLTVDTAPPVFVIPATPGVLWRAIFLILRNQSANLIRIGLAPVIGPPGSGFQLGPFGTPSSNWSGTTKISNLIAVSSVDGSVVSRVVMGVRL